jgi:hypothetical protein
MRKGWIILAAGLLALTTSVPAVVINEFYYGTASPGNNEWIEIYNRGSATVNLLNWKIAVANGGPFAVVHNISTGRDNLTSLTGQNFFLVTDGLGAGLDFDENNANLNLGRAIGPSVFGIALVDDVGTTVDTVLYCVLGATNTYNLRDDDGFTSITRVKLVTGDESYSRDDLHADTNNSSSDFYGTGGPGTPVPVLIRRFSLY